MLRRYTFWLTAAVIFQFLTAALHAVSLYVKPEPVNETERQLMILVSTYRMDAGAGFQPTLGNLFTALSSCFSLLCLLAGLTNAWLLYKHAQPSVMRGIIGANVFVFAVCFAMMATFTFLPPIICTGLIFINLLVSFLLVPNIEADI